MQPPTHAYAIRLNKSWVEIRVSPRPITGYRETLKTVIKIEKRNYILGHFDGETNGWVSSRIEKKLVEKPVLLTHVHWEGGKVLLVVRARRYAVFAKKYKLVIPRKDEAKPLPVWIREKLVEKPWREKEF